MRRIAASIVLASALVLPAAAQTTWHVDVNAVPPGNGSVASPYTNIQYAIDQPTTLVGDTILVAPGVYVGQINDKLRNGIHLRSSGGPAVTELRPGPPPHANATALLEGSTIEGFTLTGNTSSHLNGGALNTTGLATRCVVRDNPGIGVFSYNATLRDCTIVGNGRGVHMDCFTGVVMRNTIVWGNGIDVHVGCLGYQADYCAGGLPQPTGGVGNIVGDPGMWAFPGAEHLLAPGSPCIDAGDPSSPPDPDGSPADIGAIPFDPEFDPIPSVFCTAKTTSLGCVPQIGFQGHATFNGSAPFTVSATQFHPGSPGLLFYGPGAHFLPFQGAWHCVEFPPRRVGVQLASGSGLCGGTYTFDFSAHLAGGAAPFVVPGSTLACQWWSRDPADPTGFGTTLSNALLFSVVP